MTLRHFAAMLCVIAILTGRAFTADSQDPAIARALDQARQGHEDDAIATLQAEVKASPKNRGAWLLLGDILDFIGKPEDAAGAWESGIKSGADTYDLWLRIAKLRAREAEDGPTVSYSRGMVEYKPDTDKDKSAQFKKQRRELAITALQQAMNARRNNTEAALQLAAQYTAAGDHAKAFDVWDTLIASDLNNADFLLGRAQTQWALEKKDEAAKGFALALKLNPRLIAAHQGLSAYAKAAGRAEEAAEHDRQAQFYDWLPPFSSLQYSKENFATFQALNPERNGVNGKASVDARAARGEAIKKLLDDESQMSSEFLAALCFRHEDCGAGEEAMFAALGKRGKSAESLLLNMLEEPRSTCTVRVGGLTLARMKSDKVFPILVRYLPGDTRAVFHMDIAAALDELGDPRAVPELIKLLAPDQEVVDADGEQFRMFSREAARERAVLALGAFHTDEATAALQQCLKNPKLEVKALAALYRQSKDVALAQKLNEKVPALSAYDAYLLQNYFKKIDTDQARILEKACIEREEKARADREKSEQKQK